MLNSEQFNQEDFKPEENSQPLTKGQKAGAVLLAFFAFLVVVLWMIQFKNSIYSPFAYKGTKVTNQTNQPAINDEQSLKLKDTDGDELSDYDELNIYMTSPYLADSDSDGFSDRQEILSGNDPNCPKGKDCTGFNSSAPVPSSAATTGTATSSNGTLEDLLQKYTKADQLLAETASSSSPSMTDVQKVFSNSSISAVELRDLLLQSGMKKEILDQIKDDELLKSFQEILGQK